MFIQWWVRGRTNIIIGNILALKKQYQSFRTCIACKVSFKYINISAFFIPTMKCNESQWQRVCCESVLFIFIATAHKTIAMFPAGRLLREKPIKRGIPLYL